MSSSTSSTKVSTHDHSIITLNDRDNIYAHLYKSPIVIPEYKLIFFPVAKAGCTEWKLLFRELLGMPSLKNYQDLHNPLKNNITQLIDFPIQEAQDMMNSDEWTKAIFVREPKQRILSAFLNKYANDGYRYFIDSCCKQSKHNALPSDEKKECIKRSEGKHWTDKVRRRQEFSYFLNMTQKCGDAHWRPQYYFIEAKWWPKINFVGYMESVAVDSKRLLQGLTSDKDNVTAWDRCGKIGWGDDKKDGFMQVNEARHSTGARDKLKKFYTPEDEKFVEEHWSIEWNQEFFHFDTLKLYPDAE